GTCADPPVLATWKALRAHSAAWAVTAALVSCHGSSGAVPSPPKASASSAPPPAPTTTATAGIPKDLSVLVISIDSLRADMPWNGYPRPIAPRLTELEKKSLSYTHAYSISSYTSMSLGGFL